MKVVNVEMTPIWRDIFPPDRQAATQTDILGQRTLQFLGSGKAAIAMVLDYLRTVGVLDDKMAEVIMPAWIGHPVYQQVNAFGFPTLTLSPRSRVLLAYHQYGFPQDMDRLIDYADSRKLTVIEDCAHACESFYKGRPLGSMGRFAIFSFSKFSFCFALGGVAHGESEFATFIADRLRTAPRVMGSLINGFKLLDEINFARVSPRAPLFMTLIRTMAYSAYGIALRPSPWAISLWKTKRAAEISTRKKFYRYFRERTDSMGLCNHLEREGVTPYVIPIRFAESRMPTLVEKLKMAGFKTGIYHFDLNRFHPEPDFKRCVFIPCHSGVSDEDFDRIIDIVRTETS